MNDEIDQLQLGNVLEASKFHTKIILMEEV